MNEGLMTSSCLNDRPQQPQGYIGDPMPTPWVPNTIRDIVITQLSHGYIVRVGCQSFAIESASTLIAKLAEYINNPADTETKWNDKKLF
jgi:hypothetical protein